MVKEEVDSEGEEPEEEQEEVAEEEQAEEEHQVTEEAAEEYSKWLQNEVTQEMKEEKRRMKEKEEEETRRHLMQSKLEEAKGLIVKMEAGNARTFLFAVPNVPQVSGASGDEFEDTEAEGVEIRHFVGFIFDARAQPTLQGGFPKAPPRPRRSARLTASQTCALHSAV